MYCNMPELKFKIGKRVRVYVMALGTQEDLHSPNIMGEHRQPPSLQPLPIVAAPPHMIVAVERLLSLF